MEIDSSITGEVRNEKVAQFQAITAASELEACSVLEAHHWDVNDAVNFYLEHGEAPPAVSLPSRAVQWNEPSFSPTREMPTLGAPSVGPGDRWDAQEDMDLDASVMVGSGMGSGEEHLRGASPMRASLDEGDIERQMMEQAIAESMRGVEADPSAGAPLEGSERVDELERAIRVSLQGGGGPEVSPSETSAPVAVPSRSHRSLPPPRAERFPGLHPSSPPHHPEGRGLGMDLPGGLADVMLPVGVDAEEAAMLEAVMLGVPYTGTLPDFSQPQIGRRNQGTGAAEVSPGVEMSRMIREEQDFALQQSLDEDRARERATQQAQAQEQEMQRLKEQEEQKEQEEVAEQARTLERHLSQKKLDLPDEPEASAEDLVTIMVRLPDGTRQRRGFLKSNRIQALFNYIDVMEVAKDHPPGTYKLRSQFPRRVFTDGESDMSFQEAELVNKQEALFLEPI
mmetsp:Transcript_22621/g.31530  ORF Transcript_22621/g.31530 Transcript_22621/m.31530 type:complete len:453 (-) Transcript_22621:202-1560(-)|eukprot:CAMPEP_0196582272 /NCGR_PEP_ID=MMETSP1081-20130531/38406_1 /TAXON_ID=36882 /ORGANISM="Pyramimonas amylifera, Strain CCMP720" /LENGTH=452 /DNA_ID=CAMNT_0041902795 /DNA_START=59 /DNA_END=1417 /DNA_ORIENTATION=-